MKKHTLDKLFETGLAILIGALMFVIMIGFAGAAKSEPCCQKPKDQKQSQQQTVNVNVGNQGKTVWKTVNKPTERIVERVVPVNNSSVSSSTATSTYVEKVVPVEKIRVFKLTKIRTKYKLKYKTKTIQEDAPHHFFSLLLGKSKTGLDEETKTDYTTKVETENRFDAGLMYQYRTDSSFMIGVQGTMNKGLYLSLGFGL